MGGSEREIGNMKGLKVGIGVAVNLIAIEKSVFCNFLKIGTHIKQSHTSICTGRH